MLEERFGLQDWIGDPLGTRWIQEIHDTCGIQCRKQSLSCRQLRVAIGVWGRRNGKCLAQRTQRGSRQKPGGEPLWPATQGPREIGPSAHAVSNRTKQAAPANDPACGFLDRGRRYNTQRKRTGEIHVGYFSGAASHPPFRGSRTVELTERVL